jgi:predicted amidohydrolase
VRIRPSAVRSEHGGRDDEDWCSADPAVQGDVRANVARDKQFIELAVENGAGVVFFPELSLIGCEPPLASELAVRSLG